MTTTGENKLYAEGFKVEPYWWDTVEPLTLDPVALPQSVDVIIIGSGYTGIHAAIQTARGGKETLVLDAEQAGWGCSTRNGGQISTSLKPGYQQLAKKFGDQRAFDILSEGKQSLEWTKQFIEEERIDCDLSRDGRFHAAHNSAQFAKLKTQLETQVPGLETDAYLVQPKDQRQQLGTDAYHGGVVFPQHAALDPGRYHRGLINLAQQAGASIVTHCKVSGIEREQFGFQVMTPRGAVQAEKVVIATNGYTGELTPWNRRRVIPIGSYVIATESLAPDLMDRLMPANRIVSDSRKIVYYYRPSPDRSRIVFGGRVSITESDPLVSAPRLHRDLVKLFPELAETRISHSWMGFVAYTFDTLMHIGNREGLHYAMGYCGSGVGMAGYLGMRMGQQVLGLEQGATAFDDIPFPTRPLYSGRPWFLAPSVFYYRIRDSLNI